MAASAPSRKKRRRLLLSPPRLAAAAASDSSCCRASRAGVPGAPGEAGDGGGSSAPSSSTSLPSLPPGEAEETAAEAPPGRPPRLGRPFFQQPCLDLAKALLGQVLVRRLPGVGGVEEEELRGRIVETEAYLGGEDSASHSRGGRQTARNAAMFMAPGTLYVYQIYGIYFCMNLSSQGQGAAVLLRSLEPLQGLETMRRLRLARRKSPAGNLKDWHLCNGPSKLCQALALDKSFDRQDMATHPALWLEAGQDAPGQGALVCAPRIGISGDWAHKPLRFYLRGNRCVSIVDRVAEEGGSLTPS